MAAHAAVLLDQAFDPECGERRLLRLQSVVQEIAVAFMEDQLIIRIERLIDCPAAALLSAGLSASSAGWAAVAAP